MYIFNFSRIVVIVSICYFINGCESKKKSIGMDDEIRVVCSKIDEPLIRIYGRGRYAKDVTAEDCALILISILVNP